MFIQYLKIAWRNLIKYRTQSLISIVGLAIGFTAFSFTLSWIRYEKSYDSFNPAVDRIYRVFKIDEQKETGVDKLAPEPLAAYLVQMYPEIEAATSVYSFKDDFEVNGKVVKSDCRSLRTDTSFFHVFYPKEKTQFPDVLPECATILSRKMADRLGIKGPGAKINQHGYDLNVFEIAPDKPYHSNVPYDVIRIMRLSKSDEESTAWWSLDGGVYIRVRENTDIHKLAEKIDSLKINEPHPWLLRCKLVPLRELHSRYPDEKVNVKYTHLRIFAGVSLLVILCALFNYLMLFVNRIKMRNRELALRKVNGASNRGLLWLLLIEFLLLLVVALVLGAVITELLTPAFEKLSLIEIQKSYFLLETMLYGLAIAVFSFLIAIVPISLFIRRNIRQNSQKEIKGSSYFRNWFSMSCILFQVAISMLLIFCSIVFFIQIYTLNHSDIGFDRHNVNSIWLWEVPKSDIKKIPEIEDVINFVQNFLPRISMSSMTTDIDKDGQKSTVKFETFDISPEDFLRFFRIKLVEGRGLHAGEEKAVLINQTAKRALGKNVLGMKIENYTVVGVIPDLYIDSPLLPILPAIYRPMTEEHMATTDCFAYRYREGCRAKAEKAIADLSYDKQGRSKNMEEIYNDYTKSEQYLLILLGIMTGVAVLIAVFGIYSMISLACNQRRKEIAIRKVNGATATTILMMFFKQYFMMVCLACVLAFPVGYYLMHRWLEQYTRRISLEWWIFAGVFLLTSIIVLLSIISRVLKAANENPAEVVKGE